MRSFPANEHITREHFGFRDGFSQPKPGRADPAAGAKPKWDDGVNPGELFLGHPNDRDEPPYPQTPSALRDNGTFLVIRKLRQHVRAWNETLRAAASKRDPKFDGSGAAQQQATMDALAAKLMGREKDGNALANTNPPDGNDFDYAADPHGERCPFQSHVRRANPRTVLGPKARMPRLVRRGMSYGARYQAGEDPKVERGL
jgi:deferrochelatase/peroxidase EfeB